MHDIRDPRYELELRAAVERILEGHPSGDSLVERVASKLARSRRILQAIDQPAHVSVTFAMYKEHTRLLQPEEHEHGEDFLARKIEQLNWLCEGSPVTWDMLVVDDGCPEGSGEIAQRILAERFPDAPAKVLFLEEAICENLPITGDLTSTNQSQKGGSIVCGMWTAAQEERENHVVVFTDADLSTHLGQTGLLLGPILEGAKAAIGSRRETDSVVIKTGHRNIRGKLFIYLWKGMLGPLQAITDTQCGFKAFDAELLRAILPGHREMKFAVDLELLLKTELRHPGSIVKVPVAWIDSEAASTTTGLQPYLPMLKSIAGMYREHLPATPEGDEIASLIEALTEDRWQHLASNVPAAIADGDPLRFGTDRPIRAAELLSR